MVLLLRVGRWYKQQSPAPVKARMSGATASAPAPSANVKFAVAMLVLLMFSKSAYTASLSSYYTFYLIGKFEVSVQASQMLLFLFLLAQALGSLVGGHLGDRFGRREIIWFSILGAVPFTLILPFANLFWTGVLTIIIGMIMASAFPAILVYALELLPGKVGMIAGLFYGVSFGLGAERRAARRTRRPHERANRLPLVLAAAAARPADLVPARHRAGADQLAQLATRLSSPDRA